MLFMKTFRTALFFSLLVMSTLQGGQNTTEEDMQYALQIYVQKAENLDANLKKGIKRNQPKNFDVLTSSAAYVIVPKQKLQEELKQNVTQRCQQSPSLKLLFDNKKTKEHAELSTALKKKILENTTTFVKEDCIATPTPAQKADILFVREATAEYLRALTGLLPDIDSTMPRGIPLSFLVARFQQFNFPINMKLLENEIRKNEPFTAALALMIIAGIDEEQAQFKKQLDKPDTHKVIMPISKRDEFIQSLSSDVIYLFYKIINGK